jgi:uncharacterized phosphosugar-binding protein
MPVSQYISACRELLNSIEAQSEQIEQAAKWFTQSILAGRVVHLFGAGHSRIMVEEMWPRYGSFPGFNPIVELSLTFHNSVVGANGQRQAMFLENQSGFAKRILRNFNLSTEDTALVISSSGCNVVPIEIAEHFHSRGIRVVALVSLAHCLASESRHQGVKKLIDFADLVLDSGAPAGDAMVQVSGLDTPVAPGSTVGGCVVVNAVKTAVSQQLVAAGQPPIVLTAACIAGEARSSELFESAYDEHGRRIGKLLNHSSS